MAREDLATVAAELRVVLGDPAALVRAVASGRRRGTAPRWRRLELRPVTIAAGPRLQVTAYDETQAFTTNHPWDDAPAVVDGLLAEPFASWRVESTSGTWHVDVGDGGRARVARHDGVAPADTAHDRAKQRLVDPGEPFLRALGITDGEGRVRAARRDKLAQVEQFVRIIEASIRAGLESGRLVPPLRIADLGCGNAYLTFATVAWLERAGIDARVTGIDVRAQARARNTGIAQDLGWGGRLEFVEATIDEWTRDGRADAVISLHACDTATDDALAAAVRGGSALILAAPCCHHDLQAQLEASRGSSPLLRHGLLRERFGDVLTDALRAQVLRLLGYRVDVIEFVPTEHSPRNLLIRAHATGAAAGGQAWTAYDETLAAWGVVPRLAVLLADELDARRTP